MDGFILANTGLRWGGYVSKAGDERPLDQLEQRRADQRQGSPERKLPLKNQKETNGLTRCGD